MYVVAGATGQTGGAAADWLLKGGHDVRVIVRSEAKGEPWAAKGAQVTIGDLDDLETVRAAITDAEGAYLLIPPNYQTSDVIADRARFATELARGVSGSNVGHVVLLSSVGSEHPSGTGPIVTTHNAEHAFGAIENVTFLRAAYFLENWGAVLPAAKDHGVLPTFLDVERKIPMVASEDIGRVAAEILVDPRRGHHVVQLAGPADYSPREIAEILSGVLKREVKVQRVPDEAAVGTFESFGFSKEIAQLFAEMNAAINSGLVSFGAAEVGRGRLTPADVFAALLGKA